MRQTASEIDHAILDVAASIFAVHGFAHTSVQQIADAVGYSKPGLLHRFGSKEALYHAVLAEVTQTLQDAVDHAALHRDAADRVTLVLTLFVERALARPGMVQMALRALDPRSEEPATQPVHRSSAQLVDALQPSGSNVERVRVILALRLISNAALIQASPAYVESHVDPPQLVPLLVGMATAVLDAPPAPLP